MKNLFLWFTVAACCAISSGAHSQTSQTSPASSGNRHPAQPPNPWTEKCGTMFMDQLLRQQYPEMGTLEQFEQWLQQKIAEGAQNPIFKTAAVVTIPVVFHIIYSNAAENLSAAAINSQLAILNEDFRRLNADTVNTPLAFRPVAADCEVQFCMAVQDPNGNVMAEPGINRVPLPGSPFNQTSMNNTVKPTTQWDPNRYFNIWVANLGSGLLGYAQFPNSSGLPGLGANNGPANTDGVVITHTSVGRPPHNTFPGPYNLGRTLTHEVGHWLALRHIWGDGNCSVDDFCGDTPTSGGSNFGCPTNANSCGQVEMVQNYMDYTHDNCMNIFTLCQKTRMETVLSLSPRRASLLNSTVCQLPTNPPVANFSANPTNGCPGAVVQFTNTTTNGATGFSWSFPGGTPGTSTAANPSVTYNTPGVHAVTLVATNAFGTDSETKTNFINIGASGTPLPFAEDFESNSFATNGWTLNNPDNGITWNIQTVGGITPGTRAARMNFFSYGATGQRDRLTSRLLDFTGYSSVRLRFDHAYRRYNTQSTDSLIVLISTNCGQTWTRLLTWGESGTGTFATASPSTTAFAPSQANDWCFGGGGPGAACANLSLNAFIGQPDVQIRFEAFNNYGNNLFIDNINITGLPNALFTASDQSPCVGQQVTFANTSTGGTTGQTWSFAGGTPATSAAANPVVTYNTPGTYAVTLITTNASGADTLAQAGFISVSGGPSLSTAATNAACGASNGTATAVAAGGIPPYSYAWNTTPAQTTPTATGLPAGAYGVTVTDAAGCPATQSVVVQNPNAPSLALVSSQNVTCAGAQDGQIVVSGSGGTGSLQFRLNAGPLQPTGAFSNLGPGTYSVSVRDANNCQANLVVTLTEPVPVAIQSVTLAAVSCAGAADGGLQAVATGTQLTYALNGDTNASGVFAGLPGGQYTLAVANANGCADSQTVAIAEPAPLALALMGVVDASCNAASNGILTVDASGGVQPYLFILPGVLNSSGQFANLAPGPHNVMLEDSNGCADSLLVNVGTANTLSATAGSTNPSAPGAADGSIALTVQGAVPPVNIAWNTSPPQAGASLANLPAGTYTFTVTDGAGCAFTDSVSLSGPVGLPNLAVVWGLSLYPNPTTGRLTLEAASPVNEPLHCTVWNALGQRVHHETLANLAAGRHTLDLSAMPNGVYSLRLSAAGGQWLQKVVIAR